MREAIGRLPLAGVAVVTLALLALWQQNFDLLPFESVWPTMAAAVLGAGIVTALIRPLAGSWERAGLIGGLIALYLFYLPALLDLLSLSRPATWIAHFIAIMTLVLIAGRIPRDPEKLRTIAYKCNLICVALLAVNLAPLAFKTLQEEGPRQEAQSLIPELRGKAGAGSPDVWHIIFDRYAGTDTLQSVYRFDNRPFVAALRRRGFMVHDRTFSNYQRTAHSVASTLNGAMLNKMSRPMAQQGWDWVPIYRAMRDNAAMRFFERSGYRTYFAGSWWEPTRFSDIADRSIQIRSLPQLARLAIDGSSLRLWMRPFHLPYFNGREDQCFRALEKFRRLRNLASTGGTRKYVFAHFLVPHPPFVLNRDGSCRSRAEAKASSRRDNYIAQVEFANQEALRLIDAILDNGRRSVIVLHGDEGPWPEPYVGDEHGLGTDAMDVDWDAMPPSKLREKMSTMLAIRSTVGPPKIMPSSPVQIYPAMLAEHFGSRATLPPSEHFLFESDTELYHFEEVTDRLKSP